MRQHKRTSPATLAVWATAVLLAVSGLTRAGTPIAPDPESGSRSEEPLQGESRRLAEDYADILIHLDDIIRDYSQYIGELDPVNLPKHTLALNRLIKGLEQGTYVQDCNELTSDLGEIIEKITVLEQQLDEQKDVPHDEVTVVRSLRRELDLVRDLVKEDLAGELAKQRRVEAIRALVLAEVRRELERAQVKVAPSVVIVGPDGEKQRFTVEIPDIPDVPDIKVEFPDNMPKPPRVTVSPPTVVGVGMQGRSKQYSDRVDVDSPETEIMISNPRGGIEVSGWDNDYIAVELELQVSGPSTQVEKEILEESGLDIESNRRGVRIDVSLPRLHDARIKVLSSNLMARVPEDNPMIVSSSFGQVDISEVSGPVILNGAYSNIELREVRAAVQVVNTMGQVKLIDIDGDINVRNSYGEVKLTDCYGTMVIANSYDKVLLTDCEGNAEINNSGEVSVLDHDGDLTVDNSGGLLEIMNLNGSVTARNAFQPVMLSGIDGTVSITNANGRIEISDVSGAIQAANSFAPIEAFDFRGPITVINKNGDVFVTLANGRTGGSSSITTTHGAIDLSLPQNSDYVVLAKAVRGSISSDFPISVTETENHDEFAELRLGGASDSLSVTANNASIRISPLK